MCDVIAEVITHRVLHNDPANLAFGTRTSLLEIFETMMGDHFRYFTEKIELGMLD
jgi:hypothetical protein